MFPLEQSIYHLTRLITSVLVSFRMRAQSLLKKNHYLNRNAIVPRSIVHNTRSTRPHKKQYTDSNSEPESASASLSTNNRASLSISLTSQETACISLERHTLYTTDDLWLATRQVSQKANTVLRYSMHTYTEIYSRRKRASASRTSSYTAASTWHSGLKKRTRLPRASLPAQWKQQLARAPVKRRYTRTILPDAKTVSRPRAVIYIYAICTERLYICALFPLDARARDYTYYHVPVRISRLKSG